MEESKELQGFYRIFRAVVYVSVLLEFFEYAFDPAFFGDWGGILLGRHPRRHPRAHQAVDDIQRRTPCVQQAGHHPADLHHLHRHEEQEATGVQRQAAGRPALDGGPCTACPLRVAVQQADGDAAVHAAREHHPVHGRFARGRDTRSCSLGQHLEVHQGRTDEGPVQF